MKDPVVIGVADIWGTVRTGMAAPWRAFEGDARNHDVVLFTSGLALTHTGLRCLGPCAIHEPSDHHMRGLPVFYRDDRNMVERRCAHGVGHPDPDQVTFWQETLSPAEAVAQTVHGCCEDKCCEGSTEGEDK